MFEMRGDDMARVVSDLIRERLIEPYVDADLRSFDLSIDHRNQTNDTVTLDAAQALKVHNVRGVKCATLRVEKDVLEKYHFKRTWMSPNGAIGNALGGDVFRKPIACRKMPPLVKQWRRPIIIARHAFGDQYKGQDYVAPGSGTLQNKYSPTMGAPYNNHAFYLPVRGTLREELACSSPRGSASSCTPCQDSTRPLKMLLPAKLQGQLPPSKVLAVGDLLQASHGVCMFLQRGHCQPAHLAALETPETSGSTRRVAHAVAL
ncbi:isocitrate dehydrogenase [NADP] cytoplasmic [Dermacentor silvarum]|uniref:isocitrate dehydrogenase [NADP] cytoplasmic-like n=1 Tax=Dermacentor silvarum TaxID=543639 RepID=UPI00189A0790|nr:isocitrate dehydrogenase [NADP] cytoplasmic-like [Dermacentor silvarum]XP_037558063.1 isocitrate dehydrogenase [NADP] cytoplasmic [Dermacentor silvarum]